MDKLTIEQLAPYLPYGVQCSYLDILSNRRKTATLTGISKSDGIETTYKRKYKGCHGDLISFNGNNNISILKFKLHLRPLTALTKEIEVNREKFIPSNVLEYEEEYHYLLLKPLNYNMSFQNGLKLFQWHFDVFGLIEKGLAININTL